MVLPVTTLPDVVRQNNTPGTASYYVSRTGRTRQKKPYSVPTSYKSERVVVVKRTQNKAGIGDTQAIAATTMAMPWLGPGSDLSSPVRQQAINSARDKFVSKIRQDAMLAVNYAERKQAIGMIASRATQLVRFTKAVKSLRFADARDALRLSTTQAPHGAKWRRSRDAGSAFLEFHFGWEPAVHDIYTACSLLSAPAHYPSVRTRGPVLDWDATSISGSVGSSYFELKKVQAKVQAQMGATVLVTDPNIWLLNQLGLLNPAGVVWELTPWSFVWDWFFNISQWLNQWTDFVGLRLIDPWYSVATRSGLCTYQYHNATFNEDALVHRRAEYYQRNTGIPGVTLGKLPYKPLSAVRAATSMALLSQRLPKRDAQGSRVLTSNQPRWANLSW